MVFSDRGVVAVGGTPEMQSGAVCATERGRGGRRRPDTPDGQYLGLLETPKIVERLVVLVV